MTERLKILVTGADGQLGQQILKDFSPIYEIVPTDFKELDITDKEACCKYLNDFQPDWVLNVAAFTDVEKAEDEPEMAMKINRDGPSNLAIAVKEANSRLLHISTDYVFDGKSKHPLRPNDPVEAVSSYGRSKLAGEKAIESILGNDTLIIRTAWLYSATNKNFMLTMLRLMREQPIIKIVADQYGTPTSVLSLSQAIEAAVKADIRGIFHWSDAGETTWHGFASAIQEIALSYGLIKESIKVLPVSSNEYPVKASRPTWSVLDKSDFTAVTGLVPEPWQEMLSKTMKQLITKNDI